jgi:hypothetical protein
MRIRGVNYDVGTNYGADGASSRPGWQPAVMRRELRAIRDQLHANCVGLFGTDIGRLVDAAGAALDDGLQVWLQPRLVDAGPDETLAHLAEAARAAEELRRRDPAVVLNVGCELTIFSAGIIPGAGYAERGARLPTLRGWPLLPWFNRRLNAFLRRAAAVARAEFHGRLTYSAGLWERVDWAPFDIVGLDYYRVPQLRSRYAERLRRFHRHGKPVVVTEFGCAAFRGAAELGPTAHERIDHGQSPPVVTGPPVRDEQVQARELAALLDVYESSGVAGAFVFEFIEPYHPHTADPRHDLDMAGYGLVKVTPDGDSGYRWEPKAAFHEIARRYGAAADPPA